MLKGRGLPSRGSFIEVECAQLTIIGEVRWSIGNQCGVRTREVLNIPGLSEGLISAPRQIRSVFGSGRARVVDPEQVAQQSRAIARATNLALTLLAIAAAGALVSESVSRSLGAPLGRVSEQLLRRNSN